MVKTATYQGPIEGSAVPPATAFIVKGTHTVDGEQVEFDIVLPQTVPVEVTEANAKVIAEAAQRDGRVVQIGDVAAENPPAKAAAGKAQQGEES